MTMKKYFLLSALGVAAIGLSGCSGVRNSLGLEKESPDEFAVLKRAPLEMPSSMALPPPHPGMPRPQETATIKEAQQAVFGEERIQSGELSSGEDLLLNKAGAENADENIRAVVNKETSELNERNQPVVKKIMKLGGGDQAESATVVDPQKELERIQNNIKDGKDITEGDTPYIEE